MMSLNESSLNNNGSSEKDEMVDIKDLLEFAKERPDREAKTDLYIGSENCSKIDELLTTFNNKFFFNEKIKKNIVYVYKVKSQEKKTFDSIRLVYFIDRNKKARFFLRNYYPFFYDLIDGTIFIDYLYVVILNIGGEDIPFIINGPIINLEDSIKIIHYPRVIPIDFFPFIPTCYLTKNNLESLKTNYRRKLNDLKITQNDIESATVSELYRISLNDDIALVGITFNTSNSFFEVKRNAENSNFILTESLLNKLNNKKSDIKEIFFGKNNEKDNNKKNIDNTESLTNLLFRFINKHSNVSINKQVDTSDKDKFVKTAEHDVSGGKVELIQTYEENITDKEETKNYSENQSSLENCVKSHSLDSCKKTDTDSIADELLSNSDEALTNKIDEENSSKLISVENNNFKQKARINTIVRSSNYQEYKNSKKSSVAKQEQIKTIDFNSQITSSPNQNAVSTRKHGLSIVTVIIMLCLFIGGWHYKEEVKNIYFKMYNDISENHATKTDIQEPSKKTISENTEHVTLKSDFLYDIDGSGSITNNDRVEIMQKILIKAGFSQELDSSDWENTKDNVRQYLKKMKYDQFKEEDLKSIGTCFKHFEKLHSASEIERN